MQVILPAQQRGGHGKTDAQQYAHMQPRNRKQMRRARAPERLRQLRRDIPSQSQQRRLPKRRLRLRNDRGDRHRKPPPQLIQRAVERAALTLANQRDAPSVQRLRNALPRQISRIVEPFEFRRLAYESTQQQPVAISKVRRIPHLRHLRRSPRRNQQRSLGRQPTRRRPPESAPSLAESARSSSETPHRSAPRPPPAASADSRMTAAAHPQPSPRAPCRELNASAIKRSQRRPPQPHQQKRAQQSGDGEQQERGKWHTVANVKRGDRPADKRNGKCEKLHGLGSVDISICQLRHSDMSTSSFLRSMSLKAGSRNPVDFRWHKCHGIGCIYGSGFPFPVFTRTCFAGMTQMSTRPRNIPHAGHRCRGNFHFLYQP